MNDKQWTILKKIALDRSCKDVAPALIIDSPWVPGFAGISTTEYFALPDKWFEANLEAVNRFPDIIFVPGFWFEYGMATEPLSFGTKISWWKNQPPSVHHVMKQIEEVDSIEIPNPQEHGAMPLILEIYRWAHKKLEGTEHKIRIIESRGPLVLATHLRGVTEFIMDMMMTPEKAKKLLDITTETVIRWLKAQVENVPTIEGIEVHDDVPGLLNPALYDEFAHPYLQKVFSAFPADMVKIYHNDANIEPFMEKIADTGFNVLNFSHTYDIADVYNRIGKKVCLMGNIPPVEVLQNGKPEDVYKYAKDCLSKVDGSFLLSAGGGTNPGTPAENIDQLVKAVAERK